MTYKAAFRPEAQADLFALHKHIVSKAGHRVAAAYVARIETQCMSLVTFPHRAPDVTISNLG